MKQLLLSLCAAFAFVFPSYLITSAVRGSKRQQKKAVEKAISRGNVVTATLKKSVGTRGEVPGVQYTRNAQLGIYEYEHGGRKYRYKFYADKLPKTLELYFLKQPRKATVKGAMVNSNVCWPLVYLVFTLLVYWIAF